MPVVFELAGVVANDVLADAPMRALPGCDRDVVPGGPLDSLFRGGDWHPHWRMRLLDGPRPDGHIPVGPEAAFVREHLFGPRATDDLPGLLETRPRVRQRNVVDVVLARNAAGETR